MLLTLAVLPGLVLFYVVWKLDTVEKEPMGLLLKLFFCGGLTIISAMVLGLAGEGILAELIENQSSLIYLFIDNFVLTAMVEEGGKLFVLKKGTWKSKEFNYTFDGVVYAVAVSLGFAVFENILYVFESGFLTAIIRAVFSVPGHAVDAVFMGYFYGLARKAEGMGDRKERKLHMLEAFLVPVCLHGFYDFCLSTESLAFILLFLIYEIVITVAAVRKMIALSKTDAVIPGMEYTIRHDEAVWEGIKEGKKW